MLFNSHAFIFLFLPITLLFFYLLIHYKAPNYAIIWISISSLFFYAYWDTKYLLLFISSIIFNYFMGAWIQDNKEYSYHKNLFLFTIISNVGLLIFFKYTDFILLNISSLTGLSLAQPNIVLPIGISFFTFTQIAYIVDCYKGRHQPYSFSQYICFVSFFPHLIAGPILRHNQFIPQLSHNKFGKPSYRKIYMAALFFSIGLFKKVMIADSIAPYVDFLFKKLSSLSVLDAWLAALLYSFQIYFDFSAYSEMAIGLAFLMNIKIPYNFNSPYKATSIIDFWRRWHISLSNFLRDYLYIPLGGNRYGTKRRIQNLLITMLIGGIWHGAAWSFIIWGALHGLYLSINHAWRKTKINLPLGLSWFITFISVIIGWVFFRAEHLSDAIIMLMTMFGLNQNAFHIPILDQAYTMCFIVLSLLAWAFFAPNTQQLAITKEPRLSISTISGIVFVMAVLALGKNDHFIYFQF